MTKGLPLAQIEARISAAGLSPRGALRLDPDELPGLATIVLIGMVGALEWPDFAASPELADGARDPLDRYSRRVVSALADDLGAVALFPFEGPPYLPFQRWAMRAEPLFPSPLGLLIHPDYGLWHSFRGALGFAEELALPPKPTAQNPCEACAERPCLVACPVGAFGPREQAALLWNRPHPNPLPQAGEGAAERLGNPSPARGRRWREAPDEGGAASARLQDTLGYDVEACARHLRTAAGQACVSGGCLARRACPVGREFAQGEAQAAFHMAAFLANR